MSDNSKVAIISNDDSIKNAIEKAFDQYGGISKFIPSDKIIIKVNGVHFTDYSYTDPQVLDAVIKLFVENGVNPAKIFVIESCTSGLFTRMVFKISGLLNICEDNGVNIIYMDEGPKMMIMLGEDEKYEVEISKFIYDELVNTDNRKNNIYIEIPKLKTHWCTKVTLGIKLQLGLLRDVSKAYKHHYYHEERLVDIFEEFKPDFCIVDALNGIAVGPCPPQNPDILSDYIYKYNLILAGTDVVSVDAVGAKLLGLENLEVPTTRIAYERNLGIGNIDEISIITIPRKDVDSLVQNVPWELRKVFPNNVDIIYGKELACYEGCVGLTLIYLELLTLENPEIKENASFTLLFGKGFEKKELENLKEPICLVGSCCVEELGEFIKSNYDDIYEVNNCGNLGQYCNLVFNITGIDPLSQVPTDKYPLIELLWDYIVACVNNLDASLPDLPTIPQILDLISSSLNTFSKEILEDEEFRNVIEDLLANPNEKTRSSAAKIAINMYELYDKEWINIIENSLHDDSKKVLKTTLKEIYRKSKKKPDLFQALTPTIEKLRSINENKSIRKAIKKILD
ncbi:MAG: DUF362 domain-containing protein [Candidatus Lokiarchaeota archaeon]|nr:DUF362 domain-containing protein [Candidatus Lokiarchaeota archaeon]